MMRVPIRPETSSRAGPRLVVRLRPLLAVLLAYALAMAALIGPAGQLSAMPGGAPEWCRGDRAGDPTGGTPADLHDCASLCAQGQSASAPPLADGWAGPALAWQITACSVCDGEGAPAFPPAAPRGVRGPPPA